MRIVSFLMLIVCAADRAAAHNLSNEHGLAEQLTHQFVDVHHLPNLWLLFVLLLVVLQIWKNRSSQNQ